MTIKLLPPSLQNQIAAGEVVERPASIVKELVENSIDAGADDIRIEIEGGGIATIRIQDNGKGIEEEDAALVFTRYATSKIHTVDDLFSLCSFGFRGEALASIASVAKVYLKTKKPENMTAIRVEADGTTSPCAFSDGTEITVENLFWNTPVRRKFLKSEKKEEREIIKIIEHFALSNPHVGFRFINNAKEQFYFAACSGENAFFMRIQQVLGDTISSHFVPVLYDGASLNITGYITHPNFHRSSKDKQYIFVNNRIITTEKSVMAAISNSYHTLLPKGKFPSFVLCITLPPDAVDVNVHPRKTEVQFVDSTSIFHAVKNACTHALQNITNAHYQQEEPSHTAHIPVAPSGFVNNSFSASNATYPSFASRPFPASSNSIPSAMPSVQSEFFSAPKEEEKSWKIVGQVRSSFIVVEEKDGVRVVDQHAAHERVLLEMLQKKQEQKQSILQPLLTPCVFSVSQSEKTLLLQESEMLKQFGFEVEDFGGNEVAVLSVPLQSASVDIEKLFADLLADSDSFGEEFSEHRKSFSKRAMSYAACRSAKKFGHVLSFEEMEALITDWKNCDHPESCAHGRPVSVFYPYKTIENECGRY